MSYDNACKYLAEKYPAEFVQWLLAVASPDIEVLKTELTLEPIRADSVIFLRTANQILHIEFQTLPYSDQAIPFRMLDYSVRLKRQYRCTVVQVVIFLQETTNEVAFTEEYRDETTLHHYRVVRLWEQESAPFLANPALLPLATLTQTESPRSLLVQIAEQIATISDREERQNISGCVEILAGLRFKKDIIRQLFREEIMQGSVIYQDIWQQGLQRGRREGKEEGQREGEIALLLRFLKRRIGEVNPILQERIRKLSTPALEELGDALLDFSAPTDLVVWLDKQHLKEREISLIIRQLTRKIGEIEPVLIEQVRGLSFEDLEALAEALLDFTEVNNLVTWLEEQESMKDEKFNNNV